jgi:L-ribulose-5-phosphate 4-epimerase
MERFLELRRSIIRVSQDLCARGFFGAASGTSGNISARFDREERVAVTPSGQPYQSLEPEDICVIDFEQRPVAGERRPSVEAGMHIRVYRNRPDVGAVVHTHQHYASVLSVIREPIPPLFDEVSMYLGSPIQVVPYAISGSPELAANVVKSLGDGCNAYILQNHGALCLGETLEKAVRNAELLEKVAQVYYHALCTGRQITLLPPDVAAMFQEVLKARSSP